MTHKATLQYWKSGTAKWIQNVSQASVNIEHQISKNINLKKLFITFDDKN